MVYVDGFVVPARRRLSEYKKMARKTGKIWIGHGALSFTE
jgi:uncharacterized protein YbaA (DUF1428 family)